MLPTQTPLDGRQNKPTEQASNLTTVGQIHMGARHVINIYASKRENVYSPHASAVRTWQHPTHSPPDASKSNTDVPTIILVRE